MDGRRDDDIVGRSGDGPSRTVAAERAVVDEHRHHLLDEQRVALGGRDDPFDDGRLQAGAPEDLVDHATGVVVRQRREQDQLIGVCLGPCDVAVNELVAGRTQQEYRCVLDQLDEVVEQVEQGRLGRVDVIDDHDQGPFARQRLQELAGAPEQLGHRELRLSETDRRRDAFGDRRPVGGVDPFAVHEVADLRERFFERVLCHDPRGVANDLRQRPERDAVAVREASAAHDPCLAAGGRGELLDETRLADAGIAHDRQQLGPPLCRDPEEGRRQPAHLGLASHERCGRALAGRRSGPDTDEPIGLDRFGLALERERRDRLDLDLVAGEPVRQFAQNDLARTGRLFQPRCRVDGIAGHEPLAGGGVAGDHFPGVDPDVIVQLDAPAIAERLVEVGQRRLHLGGGAHGADRVVLVPDRQPVDGHHGVADELLDRRAVPSERGAHRVEVACHHLPQRLRRYRLAGDRRRPRVGEDERDRLPAFA